jgi:hypothetical protein
MNSKPRLPERLELATLEKVEPLRESGELTPSAGLKRVLMWDRKSPVAFATSSGMRDT